MDEIRREINENREETETALGALKYNDNEGPKDREVLVALSKTVHGLFEGINIDEGRTALVNVKNRSLLYLTDNVVRPFYRKQAIRN